MATASHDVQLSIKHWKLKGFGAMLINKSFQIKLSVSHKALRHVSNNDFKKTLSVQFKDILCAYTCNKHIEKDIKCNTSIGKGLRKSHFDLCESVSY